MGRLQCSANFSEISQYINLKSTTKVKINSSKLIFLLKESMMVNWNIHGGGGVNQKTFHGVGMNNYFLEQHNVIHNLLTI